MVYGRVIGNELRDVPPECLPIWGQRWSGYHTPHGPSPFSTRIFTVDQMSQVGPALTSPTQFEVTLTEEDEGEDANPGPSQLRDHFFSSPSAIQVDAAELTFRPEIPISRFDHRSPNYLHDTPDMSRSGHLPPRSPTRFGTTSLSRWQSEAQFCASEPQTHPFALRHGAPIQGGYGLPEDDYRTSIGTQLRAGHSHPSQIPRGLPPYPYSVSEWRFTDICNQSSTCPFQCNTSSRLGSSALPLPFQADDGIRPVPTSSFSHYPPMSFPRQNPAIDPSVNHSSNMTMIPSIAHSMLPSVPQGSILPNPSFPGPLENHGLPPGPEVFSRLVSNHRGKSTHGEDFLGAFLDADTDNCALLMSAEHICAVGRVGPASLENLLLAMSSHIRSSESQHSANPDTPPPEYSVHIPDQHTPPSSQHSVGTMPGHYPYGEQPLSSQSTGPQFAPPPNFGPTPLMQSQPTLGLLPYYDPQSPYSIEAATARAKWRFTSAALWAIGLVVCLFLLGTLERLRVA